MKKYILSFGLIIAFAFYALLYSSRSGSSSLINSQSTATATGASPVPSATASNSSASGVANTTTVRPARRGDDEYGDDDYQPVATTPSKTTTSSGSGSGTGSSGSASTGTGSAGAGSTATASSGAYKNGTYTGPSTDAYFGNVQVQAVISGGKLSNVTFLQYPSDRSTSVRINSQAMPILVSEAIQAQNANVDIVSGATQTSQAFSQSLGAALAQAK